MKKKIGIVDADLLGRKRHRFPNLACEKISAYWKAKGAIVELLLDYDHFDDYDEIYVSKVFTDTEVPKWIQETDRIHLGGTGFFFDKAPNLPEEIEHYKPDYDLYNEWIENEVYKAKSKTENKQGNFNEEKFRAQFKEYTDYSIGFLTRGCFRKCGFCVNKKYDRVFVHSNLNEFYDDKRKKICLLDDNFLGCPQWESMFNELVKTGKSFKFKQGLDERLLTEEKCKLLFDAKYDGDYTFAFDNIGDYDLIHRKLQLIRKYTNKTNIKFYVLVGYESVDHIDIENAFIRINLLLRYGCIPYIMRYQNKNDTPWKMSKYKDLYIQMARWGNQPSLVKRMTFREFCEANQALHKTKGTLCAAMKALIEFENDYPDIANKYFNERFHDVKEDK